MLVPAPHSVCFFVATPPSAAWISLFFSPSTSMKVPVSVYFSFLLNFYYSFFVWLYPVNPGFFDLSVLIYIFQYMDILFLLLSFAFREKALWTSVCQLLSRFCSVPPFLIWNKENWRTKGLSEQVFASCNQDFVFFAQEIFTVVHPSLLTQNAWWCAWAMSLR